MRHPRARHREIFLTGTPEQLNWGHEVAQNDAGRYDLGLVVGRTADNVHLPGQFISMLERAYDENQRAAYMNGLFVNLTVGRVYSYFDRSVHMGGVGFVDGEVMAGVDFNVDHLTAVVFRVWGDRFSGIRVFPDPSGGARRTSAPKTDVRILQDKGFRVEMRPKQPAVQKLLREGRLSVAGCACLVRDLEQVVWRGGDIDKVTKPELTHASDAVGYAIEKLFPVPLPEREYGRQPEHWRA